MPSRGGGAGGKRGGRGGRGCKPQRGSRSVPTEEEVLARNANPTTSSDSSEKSEEETQTHGPEQVPKKGPLLLDTDAEDLLGAGNPNRNRSPTDGPREPTRREREAMEKAQQAALMQKLQAEGKTSRARADLERLAEVRRRREEAARAKAASSS